MGTSPAVVLGVKFNGADVTGVTEAVTEWAGTSLVPNTGNAFSIETVITRDGTSESIGVVGDTGGRTDPQSPPSVSVLVRKQSALSTRHGRGRSYWPGLLLDSEVNDAGGITSGRVDDLQTIMDALRSGLADAEGATLAILGSSGGTPGGIAVNNYIVQATTATQRRRLRK
jgi:hypothetical protein